MLSGIAESNGHFVLTGSDGYDNTAQDYAAAWYSDDGLRWAWTKFDGPRTGTVGSPVAAADRFFAPVSGGLQSSETGATWATVDDPDFAGWHVNQLAVSNGGLLAFGTNDAAEGRVWESSDGAEWTPSDSSDAAHVASKLLPDGLVTFDGSLYALAQGDDVEAWRLAAPDLWERVGELPGSGDVYWLALAANARGLVALSMWPNRAWSSADAANWSRSDDTPTTGFEPEFLAVAGTDDGFVATTGRYPRTATGIFNEENVTGLTFASTRGRSWSPQPSRDWDGREIDLVFTQDDYLIGIGRDFYAYPEIGTIWTAPYPDLH